MTFHGATYQAAFDFDRLRTQLERVEALMADARWRTLGEIAGAIGSGSEAGVSARLRDMRRRGWVVNRQRRGDPRNGLHEYQALKR